jgi:flagellar protein FlbD
MIHLTQINNTRFYLNPFHIETIEQVPDTLITLTNGKKLLVLETPQEVVGQYRQFLRSVSLLQGFIRDENGG